LYKRSLAIKQKALGPDHPDVATVQGNLAMLYQAQGQYAPAELLQKRALAIFEKALGPEHPAVATSLGNLAELYRAQGRYAAADPLCKRSLAIDEKAHGPNHPDVARDLNNLAALYEAQGQYAAAERDTVEDVCRLCGAWCFRQQLSPCRCAARNERSTPASYPDGASCPAVRSSAPPVEGVS